MEAGHNIPVGTCADSAAKKKTASEKITGQKILGADWPYFLARV
jgi:hypothetical protein